MSEKEKAMIEKIAQLPSELQNRIVDQIDGAIMAMDMPVIEEQIKVINHRISDLEDDMKKHHH